MPALKHGHPNLRSPRQPLCGNSSAPRANHRPAMRLLRNAILAGGLCLATLGCASNNIDRKIKIFPSYAGPGIRFEQSGGTFDWLPEPPQKTDARAEFPHVHKLFIELVDAELIRKGFRHTTGAKPDHWLDYKLGKRVVGDPYSPGDRHFAQLTLDVLDPISGKLARRFASEIEIDRSAPPRETRTLIERGVSLMLADVPNLADTDAGGAD